MTLPSAFIYELAERTAVARLLFMSLDGLEEDQIIQARFELCKRKPPTSTRR
jgi:hypothetical protein